MSKQCEMIIGYLVPHRCENRSVSQCVQCQRFFCETHVDIGKGGIVCVACQQGLEQPAVMAETAKRFTESDWVAFNPDVNDDYFDDDDMFADLS